MKKILLTFITLALCAPLLVSAMEFGPYDVDAPPLPWEPTYKLIESQTYFSLAPSLQNDYLIGRHYPIRSDDWRSPARYYKYSEKIRVISRPQYGEPLFSLEGHQRLDSKGFSTLVLLNKKYFLTRIAEAIKNGENAGSFTQAKGHPNQEPNITIYVLDLNEILSEYQDLVSYLKTGEFDLYGLKQRVVPDNKEGIVLKMNFAIPVYSENDGLYDYAIFSTDHNDYGEHIYATKGDIIEAQYIDVDKGSILTDADLQIINWDNGRDKRDIFIGLDDVSPVVPIISPLKSVKNYWMFTKKNGKLVLAWQKSEYGLDDGSVKTITNTDKNVSAALLFGGHSSTTLATSSQAIASSSVPLLKVQNAGFFSRFFQFILSWFK